MYDRQYFTKERCTLIQAERAELRRQWSAGQIDSYTYEEQHHALVARHHLLYGYRSAMCSKSRAESYLYGTLEGHQIIVSFLHSRSPIHVMWPDLVYVGLCTYYVQSIYENHYLPVEPARTDTPEQRRVAGWRSGNEPRRPTVMLDGSWDDIGVDLTNEELRKWGAV